MHNTDRPDNRLRTGEPIPLRSDLYFTRAFYPCIVYKDYPTQVEIDIFYEPTDSHIYLVLPYGIITVKMIKEAIFKHMYPDEPAIGGQYLNQIRVYPYSDNRNEYSNEYTPSYQDKHQLAYQDFAPNERSAG